MTYAVRKASPDDVADLVTLLNEIDAYYGDTTTDTIALRSERVATVVANASAVYVAVAIADDGAVAGMASCSFLWPAEGSNSSLYMKELYVREGHRRRGIGRLLFEQVTALAKEAGCTRIEWTAESQDKVARNFYSALGDCEQLTTKTFYRKIL